MKVDVLRQEFIGKHVIEEKKKVEGKIIDETKNSFLVKTAKGERKRLLKSNSLFRIKMKETIDIPGNLILMKPEDRIRIKKW